MTAKDFFVAQRNLAKPNTAQKNFGGTLGGPIKKDKMHFFYSLDRIIYDEGRSNTFDARPELNYSNTQSMKLWNHMIRVDNQVNAGNSWTGRYLVEVSPTYDRVAGRWTLASRDQEYDVDRTVGGAWNSVFGNTRFNQVRAGYTYERNGFTAKELQQDPPIPMTQLPPTLSMLTFTDGTRNAALFRIDNAYEISETFTQFVPQKFGGENDFKFGASFIYSQIELPDQTDMNGRFTFSTDLAFDANNPRTYPERLVHPRPGRERHQDADAGPGDVRAGQVAPEQPDAQPRRPLRPRDRRRSRTRTTRCSAPETMRSTRTTSRRGSA